MINKITNEQFIEIYNDVHCYPTIRDVALALGIAYKTAKNRAGIIRREFPGELVDRASRESEKLESAIAAAVDLSAERDHRAFGRATFERETGVSESVYQATVGTFPELLRAAGINHSREQARILHNTARHASFDKLEVLSEERKSYGDRYQRPKGGRWLTILGCNDLHDIEIDRFWLRVFLDTARRVQPDVIVLNGDIFDLPEFGKYTVDPRGWDVVARIKFVHEHIFKPLREACPNAQIDLIEGNHEHRLLRHLGEASPAIKVLLSDLHGWTIPSLLGLDKFEINYVARGDLKSFNKKDQMAEVGKNYQTYANAVLACHFPDASRWGMPGWNGHHHSHIVTQYWNPTYRSYEWHQFGCGHRLAAEYTMGERWGMGFSVINVDTHSLSVNFDYVQVTDFAVSGGKWYHRDPGETYSSPSVFAGR